MSDIAPRPWWSEAEYVAAHLPNKRPNGEVIGSFYPSIRDALSPTQRRANAAHAVACVNAIYAAGITPEALARDPGCVAKLVEAARHVVAETKIAPFVIDFKDNGPKEPTEVLGEDTICYGCGSDPDAHDPKCSRFVAESALRACGIEVTP